MTDLIVILVVASIVALAGWYVHKAKKSGRKCVGCPHSKTCSSKTCSCSSKEQ